MSRHTRIVIHGVEAASGVCEVCGQDITRLQVQPTINPEGFEDYTPAGPWYEAREHQRAGVRHHFWQEHNCIRPQPDRCPFCAQTERIGYDQAAP